MLAPHLRGHLRRFNPCKSKLIHRPSRRLTEDGRQRLPRCCVHSRMASSRVAICCSTRSGAVALMPVTSRASQPSPSCRWGATQQSRLDGSFLNKSIYCPVEPLDHPGRILSAVQDPYEVAPGLVGAHPPHGRQPRVQWCQTAVQVLGISVCPDRADRGGVASAHAGVAADAALSACGAQPDLGALGDQRSLEPDDDEGITRIDVLQQPCQDGPAAVGAAGVLLQGGVAAGRTQCVELRVVPCSSVESRAWPTS